MVLDWVSANLLAVATFVLAVVTVGATWWATRHDRKERQRERRYARILHIQDALRLSMTLAGELDDARSWRAHIVPVLVATYVGLGSVTKQWDKGRAAELVTLLASSRNVGADSPELTRQHAFLRSASEVAGLLGQLGPAVPTEVVERLRQTTMEYQNARRPLPWRSPVALQNYIAAVNAAHVELGRIIRDERLEAPRRRTHALPRLPWRRRGLRAGPSGI